MVGSAVLARRLTPRGLILLLLAAATLLGGLGQAGTIAAAPEMRDFLKLPNNELAIADGAAALGFYLALVLGGVLDELFGTARAILICGAGTVVAMGLTGSAWTLTVLVLGRLLLGLSAGAMLPAAAAALAPWTPPRERGWAVGSIHAAIAVGSALAWPLFGLAAWLGLWRGGFFVVAGLAATWVFACRLWFRPNPGDAAGEPIAAPLPVHWRGALPILLLPTLLAIVQGWGMALCQEWVPRYLLATWHFDIKLSNWVSVVSGGAMILGCLAGGIAADRSLNHSSNIRSAHQIVPGVGFLLAAISLIMLPIGEDQLAIALWLGLALFGLQAAGMMLWVFAIDIGGQHTGISAGFVGLGLLLSRLISPLYLFRLGHWIPAVLGVAMLLMAGVLSFRLRPDLELPVLRPPARLRSEPGEEAATEIDGLLETARAKGRARV